MLIKKLCLTALLFYLSMTSQGIKAGQSIDKPVASFDIFNENETAAAETEANTGAETEPLRARRPTDEVAADLAAFGLYVPDEVVNEIEDTYRMVEVDEAYAGMYDYYLEYDPGFEYRMLLSSWGYGDYDDDWNWIPTSDKVYAFDTEVFDMGCMYTDFLNGVIAISGGEFEITDIVENTDDVNYEEDSGTQVLSFRYNGTPYTFEAIYFGDWLDCEVIEFMNQVFETEGNPKRLLATDDGGQGCILFYNTPEWGDELEAATGMHLREYFY